MPIEVLGPRIYNLPDGITPDSQGKVKPTISKFIDSPQLEAIGDSVHSIDIDKVHLGRFYVTSNKFTVLVWDGVIDFLHLEEEAISAIQSAGNENQQISLANETNRARVKVTCVTKESDLILYELANPDDYASYQQLLKTPEEIIRATYEYFSTSTLQYTFSAENPTNLKLPDQRPELTIGIMKTELYPTRIIDWVLNHHIGAEALREKTDVANIVEALSKIQGIKPLVGKSYQDVIAIKEQYSNELMKNPLLNNIGGSMGENNRFIIMAYLNHEPTPEEEETLPSTIGGVPIQYTVIEDVVAGESKVVRSIIASSEPAPTNDVSSQSRISIEDIVKVLRGETEEDKKLSSKHLDWEGVSAFLQLYESTRGSAREAIIQAIGDVLKSANDYPIDAAQLIDLVSALDIAQLHPIIENIQVNKLVGGNMHLQDAINEYFALRKLDTLK